MAEKILNQDIVLAFIRHNDYRDNLLFDKNTNSFYLYNGCFYKFLSDQEMIRTVNSFILLTFPAINISPRLVNDVITMVSWQCYRQVEEIDTPYIALKDCLLNTNTFEFEDFSQEKIATNLIPVSSDAIQSATAPLWEEFLSQILVTKQSETDPSLISFTQEMFGYYLTNTNKAHASFFLVGEGRNGKSVLLSVLREMIGKENVANESIESLTTKQFSGYNLIGKKVNMCFEEESRFSRSDKFKAIISGDPIHVEQKFKQGFSYTPKCKHIFATNILPSFEGLNKGLLDRIFIIPFYRYFKPEERDPDLILKLLQELPGVLKWAIEGGKRLQERRYRISKPQAVIDMSTEFMETISSAVRYFNEEWEISSDKEYFTTKKEVYSSYISWCEANGRKEMNSTNFFKDLKSNIDGIGDEKNVRVDGVQLRAINLERKKNDQIPVDLDIITLPDEDINNINF